MGGAPINLRAAREPGEADDPDSEAGGLVSREWLVRGPGERQGCARPAGSQGHGTGPGARPGRESDGAARPAGMEATPDAADDCAESPRRDRSEVARRVAVRGA